MEKIFNYIKETKEAIRKIILSDSFSETKKIIAHPIKIKGEQKWQIERFRGNQVFHQNVDFELVLDLPFNEYKQITIEQIGKTAVFSQAKNGYKLKEKQNNLTHKP